MEGEEKKYLTFDTDIEATAEANADKPVAAAGASDAT